MAENISCGLASGDAEVIENLKQIEKNIEKMEKEVQSFSTQSPYQSFCKFKGNSLIMRHLLLLFRSQKAKNYRNIISRQLSFIICQKNGLMSFIRETCDFDKTSEKQTTFDEKFQALSTIITKMPDFHTSLEDYYQCLGPQIIKMLTSQHSNPSETDNNKWKLIAFIVNGFYEKNSNFTKIYILSPLTKPILEEDQNLTITHSLTAIYRLIVTHFSKNYFIDIFPNLFYISVHLHQKPSHLKTLVNEIIFDLLNSIEHSLYLIDYSLFNCFSFYDLYTLSTKQELSSQEIIIKLRTNDEPNPISEIEKIDSIVQFTVDLFNQLSDFQKIDLFLLFLDKLSNLSSKYLLFFLLSVVETLQETVFNLILVYPSKAIQFLTTNLKRLSSPIEKDTIENKINNKNINDQELDATIQRANLVHQDSLFIVLQILEILLEERQKLSEKDIIELKDCDSFLEKIFKLKQVNDVTQLKIQSLIKELKNLSINQAKKSTCVENEFDKIILGLRSKFMPLRAHSLITLRRLIDRKDSSTIKNRDQLLTLLKANLKDPESYIYLHSINALSSLALTGTDHVLTILIDAFRDKTRSIEERVKVGQVLAQLNKYIGDMAHHYSKQLINCFLKATQDENVSIRVSSISNLGQLCMALRYGLSYYIVEIIHAIQCLLQTDPEMNVKRACIMFIYMLMSGIEKNTFQVIQNEMKTIYKMIKTLDSTCLGDDVLRIYAHLALKEIDEKIKEQFKQNTPKIIEIN